MQLQARGFTLLGMVACLLLVAMLLVLAVPALGSALARSHAGAARSALLASLSRAVTHAAATGSEVVLCPAAGGGCLDGWDWSGGWIAYADIDGDRIHDPAETLLVRQPALDDDIRLFSSKGRRRLVFQPNGGNAGSNVTFILCTGHGPKAAAVLVLSNRGRLREGRASAGDARRCLASR